MYHHFSGKIIEKQIDQVVVDCQGVGYSLTITEPTYQALPKIGESSFIYAHLAVRENDHQLYGFYSKEERALFLQFIKVSGVGPSLAMSILNQANLGDLVQAVISSDVAMLTKFKGIGKKTAERIIIELRDRLASQLDGLPTNNEATSNTSYPEDAFLALLTLGLSPDRARSVLEKLSKLEPRPVKTDDWIRMALKHGA